jgi:hypothetical protein
MIAQDSDFYLTLVVREIGNGIWFMLSAVLAVGFASYIIRTLRSRKEWENGPWAVFAASALLVWFIGSGLRAGNMWVSWLVTSRGEVPPPWVSSTTGYVIATALGVIGATWCIAIFHRWKVWLTSAVLAIGVPVGVHLWRIWT